MNVCYNRLLILNKDVEQQECFAWIVAAYNATVYPLVLLAAVVVVGRAARGWRLIRDNPSLAPEDAADTHPQARHGAAGLDAIRTLLSRRWFPGGLLFPAGLDWWTGPLEVGDYVHFAALVRSFRTDRGDLLLPRSAVRRRAGSLSDDVDRSVRLPGCRPDASCAGLDGGPVGFNSWRC